MEKETESEYVISHFLNHTNTDWAERKIIDLWNKK